MKIAISVQGNDLNALVDLRFGRCQHFIIIDSDTRQFSVLANSAVSQQGGAGISAAQTVCEQGVGAVITGNMGPNAWRVLSAANIEVYSCSGIPVDQALEAWSKGELVKIQGPTSPGHHGGR